MSCATKNEMKGRSIQLGDLFEIPTPRGLAYVQYVYHDRDMGELIRLLPGIYDVRPEDTQALATQREVFFTFFPIVSALNEKILRRIGTAAIPPEVGRPPLMRSPGRVNQATKTVENWWLWDGTRSWRVDHLEPEQKQLSVKAIWTGPLLIDRIVQGWRPSDYG